MLNAIVSSDMFKFLDIRSENRRPTADRRYIIDRSELKFSPTHFEKSLQALKRSGGKYSAELGVAASKLVTSRTDPFDAAFAEKVTAVIQLLMDRSLSPEETGSKVAALLPQPADIQAQLVAPAAALWDCYLARVIIRTSGLGAPDQKDGFLAEAIRAVALFFLLNDEVDAEIKPSRYLMGSIRIGTDLIDVEKLREEREIETPGVGDDTARLSQDTAVSEVVQLELALSELRNYLNIWSATPPPPAPPGPPPAADALITMTSPADLVSIPVTAVSTSTATLLTRDYDGVGGPHSIEGIDLPRTIARIDQRLRDAGQLLFALASSQDLTSATQQLRLLGQELARSTAGTLDPKKVARLPLLLPTPTLGPTPTPGKPKLLSVRALGVGDLKIVKQTLLRYDAGEVAHIENVLVGQTKERLHSVKQSTEETIFVSTERSASVEKDLQSTDRFELAEETQNTIKQERANETGVTITASYGPVSVSANTRFNDSSSQEQSSKVSRQFARETVNRSVEKVEQKVREERTRKTTLQIEETNRYTQEAKSKSVVGIYRWVDKVYRARVHVYGKRMMLEFMVPEPAGVFLRSRTFRPDDPGAVTPPEPLTFGPNGIDRSNYAGYAARYGADVEAPPPPFREMHMTLRSNTDTQPSKIEIADGWVAIRASGTAVWMTQPNGSLFLQIGHAQWDGNAAGPWYSQSLAEVSGEVPVAVTTNRVSSYNVMASVIAVPTPRLEEKWRLDTYKAIRTAYELRLSEYRDYLASQRQAELNLEITQDSESRAIERRELQRSCIELLTQQHFDALGAINSNPNSGWPEIDFGKVGEQGERAGYFQQSFEWEQMTYIFYPYFWGRQSEWKAKLASSGGDALFGRFLAAGFARVVVPVKPAHESDVAYFLETGVLWQGTEPPTIGDPRYVDILEEIKESLDAPDEGKPDGDAWQFKIPTSLVVLDESEKLPAWPMQPGGQGTFTPSIKTCDSVPYNLAQWPDSKAILVAIRALGYSIPDSGDATATLRKARRTIRALQIRFNQLGAAEVVGRPLDIDGDPGPCTLRALSYFTALLDDGNWPGVG